MFDFKEEKLKELGAFITVTETKQQPRLWREVFENYSKDKKKIDTYLGSLAEKHNKIRVIFTGAGTSAYVGDTVVPYLKSRIDENVWSLNSIPTTDIVSNPYEYLNSNIPTLMISFGRSGNSPESVAAVELGKQIIKDFYQITITCDSEGKLGKAAKNDENNLLLLMPKDSNDKGFAMTGSYTCMTLTAFLIFDTTNLEEKARFIDTISILGEEVIKKEKDIQKIVDLDFNRIIYLGSGSLLGMAREASLKVLELTAGKIATLFDSPLGFRHGPKSFTDEKTLVLSFISNNEYTRRYDVDILNELNNDKIARYICGVTMAKEEKFSSEKFIFEDSNVHIPDGYLTLPYIMFAQTLGVMCAIKLGNRADTPSPTGTVNRVVKGVTIHPYSDK